jgi:hypothetical protein
MLGTVRPSRNLYEYTFEGFTFVLTCAQYPEQYDVFLEDDEFTEDISYYTEDKVELVKQLLKDAENDFFRKDIKRVNNTKI